MSTITERLKTALTDRYRIEHELGAGGMATVYLAEDLKHDRKVALKVLRPELAAVLGAERFVQEIKTTASLQHPHILSLFESGEAGGFLFYVMPYIEGETLRDKLDRESQLSIDEAVRITTEVADALDYAHRHAVIHRDIKPENILLYDGRPMVADFGIALALSAAAGGRMTETGLSLGTPHYMSPEQATAEKDITGRSDVYSLGCVLYEMLTGTPPHVGSSAQQIIMKIVTEAAAPVTSVRKSVPAHVSATVAKSLEKLPADRFSSAHEFSEALQGRGAPIEVAGTTVGGTGAADAGITAGWQARLRDPFVIVPSLAAIGLAVVVIGSAGPREAAAQPDADDFQLVVSPNWITEFRQRVAESK
jgi:serine/threonine protein kinase